MNTPNNKRRQNTDEAIVRAAFTCMVQGGKPVSKITVREICEQAGVNRSTFYAHYLDVYDLFEKVELQMAEMCYERIHQNFASRKSFFTVMEGVFQFVKEYQEFYLLYFTEITRASHLIEVINAPFQKQIKKIREEDMGFGVPGERAYHFQFFTAGISAMLIAWLLGNCKETPGEMVEVIGRIYGPHSLWNSWNHRLREGAPDGERDYFSMGE